MYVIINGILYQPVMTMFGIGLIFDKTISTSYVPLDYKTTITQDDKS